MTDLIRRPNGLPDLDRMTKREAYEAGLTESRAVVARPPVVTMSEAAVMIPGQPETRATKTSMRSSWHRGEFWLIVSFQAFITWAGVSVMLAAIETTLASKRPEINGLIGALTAISAIVGAIPFLYLNKRVTERKEAVEDAAPTVVVNRRAKPPANGATP